MKKILYGQQCPGLGQQGLQAHNTPTAITRPLLDEKKLTIPEAARVMGIGITSLRRIIAEGRLPVLNILHKALILESDIETFLQEARVTFKPAQNVSARLPPLPEAVIRSPHLKVSA